jgi:hypothetical protein
VPTVIDSLIVKLGLDPAGFTKGQKEAAAAVVKQKGESEKWRKSAETDAKKVTEAFTKFKKEVIALTLAWFGLSRIKTFTGNLVTSGAEVLKLSSLLGMSVDQLSLWEHAANKLGATSGEMGSAFSKVVQMASELRELGTTPGLEGDSPLVRAGIDMAKFADQTTSAEDRMFMLSDALSKLRPETALLWGQQIGFSNDIIFLLRQGPEAIRRALEEQKRLNFEPEAQAKTLLKLQQDWNRFVDVIQRAGKEILIAIEPSLLRLARDFENWLVKSKGIETIAGWAKDLAKWLDSIKAEEVTRFVSALEAVGTALSAILKTLGGITTAMGALLGARIGAAFGPWGALIGLIAGGVAPNLPGMLERAQKSFRESDWFKDFAAKRGAGFEGSTMAWLAGVPEANKANPPVMPSAASIKPTPGTVAGPGVANVSINNVNIYTHATDAAGMAKGARSALTRELSTVTQASGGGQ